MSDHQRKATWPENVIQNTEKPAFKMNAENMGGKNERKTFLAEAAA